MTEKKRYSDEELEEFKQIILSKLELAKRDYQQMMDTLSNKNGNDVDDTMPTYKILEEGSMTQTKEELTTMAAPWSNPFTFSAITTFGRNLRTTSMKSKNSVSSTCSVCPSLKRFSFPHVSCRVLAIAIVNVEQGGEPSRMSRLYNASGNAVLSLNVCIGSRKAYRGWWFFSYKSITRLSISLHPTTSKPANLYPIELPPTSKTTEYRAFIFCEIGIFQRPIVIEFMFRLF